MATSSAKSKSKQYKKQKSRTATTNDSAKSASSQPQQTEPKPIASSLSIARRAANAIWTYRMFFLRLSAVYWVVDYLFIQTLSQLKVGDISGSATDVATRTLNSFSTLITSAASSSSGPSQVYHLFFILLFSLATIWALQRIVWPTPAKTGELKAKLAFYEGPAQLVPFMLITVLMVIQLLPLALVLYVYGLMTSGLILAPGWQQHVALVLLVVVGAGTLSWLGRTVVALYDVANFGKLPLEAYATAKQLVAGRKASVARKLILLPLLIFAAAGIVTIPLILIWPALARIVFYILIPFGIIAFHTCFYILYRELNGD